MSEGRNFIKMITTRNFTVAPMIRSSNKSKKGISCIPSFEY